MGSTAGDAAGVFAADPAIGRDLAAVDWASTALGDVSGWPQSLRTAVSILLSSRFSMWLAWGPELTFFCNGAYRRDTLGQKYPWALGRPASEVWQEIWEDVRPRIERVLTSGKATWDRELLLILERSGYPEETYHTFSYSPLSDDGGAVVGMLCVVAEETERVIAERRMATLRDLGSDPSVVRNEQEVLEFTAGQLERNRRDLPFTLTYLYEEDGSARLAAASGIDRGHPAAPARLSPADDAVWPVSAASGDQEPTLVDLAALDLTALDRLPSGAWPAPPTQAVVIPLRRPGASPSGFMVAALNRYRPFDEGYQGFVELVAGHLAAGLESARNYQAQQRRAEELAALDRAKTAFFSNISHEFRTPLTLITGPVQELRARLADADPRLREEAEVIHRNGLRLGKLVNALLDFSRIEADRMQVRYEPVDLSALTAELASAFRSAIEKAGLEFEVDAAPLPQPVYVDRGMWEKVVFNLLSNALKFTFAGRIAVRLRARGRDAVVTVSDTGVGIAEAEMPRLFERFHRIEHVRARSTEGSGIGLALVKELVELHGATITAESREGEGSTFTITLPFGCEHLPADAVADAASPEASAAAAVGTAMDAALDPDGAEPFVQEALRWLPSGHDGVEQAGEPADLTDPAAAAAVVVGSDASARAVGADPAAAAAADGSGAPSRVLGADPAAAAAVVVGSDASARVVGADPAAAATAGGRGAPARVLIADDNADMREYLARLLRGAGHRVTAVADGLRALEAVRADPPDLIISDVMMPGLDGLEMVTALRAEGRTASVPVLLLSARAGQEAAIRGLDAGADDYLVKPFSASELLARVRAGVELARLRAQHARWRAALIDSLQEGFFVGEADGTVVEVNATFAEILGYGPEALPARPPQPWWPDARNDPTAYALVQRVFADAQREPSGEAEVPLVHRDGRRVWGRVSFNRVEDPANRSHVIVGTVRDVTAEHYAARRESALAALAEQLARAETAPEALHAAAGELAHAFAARRVVLAAFSDTRADPAPEPELTRSSDGTEWTGLPERVCERMRALSRAPQPTARLESPGAAAATAGFPGGQLVAWMDLGSRRPTVDADLTLLAELAGRLGEGLARVTEIDRQREAAIALQHAILGPDTLPAGFAARYQPAARPLQVGGDWYDIVPLPAARFGIVVGDCVGHGLRAATVMGQLRSACRALLLEHADPVRVLAGLDRFAALLPGAECTSVLAAVLDPASGDLVWSAAGHPPPVLVTPDGTITVMEGGRGLPVASGFFQHREQRRLVIPPRAGLLLYTDGLVERRGRSMDRGIGRAAALVHDGRGQTVEELAGTLMSALAPDRGYEDDVALLLYRQPGPLEIEFAAEPEELAAVRAALRAWLERCDLAPQQALDVLIAVGEACANAIEHGHRERPAGPVTLRATALPDRLLLSVTDSGSWKDPGPGETGPGRRGHGIGMMRALMHEVVITSGPDGTTVDMYTRIPT